ncbi:MAG: isopentenyl-diphosphate Delta-isomerase [Chitinophagales bacterium]|jgi:isopentenyl-diphosphate delta-isomerase|nr:isopentenyl-diphosphate Delta-isomerase [Chitinophagales bacterium]
MVSTVVLVDENDREIGLIEKIKAHELGLLHRAISVFLYDKQGNILLQQRASSKYHFANLWANACCSHPYPGESYENAAQRRLKEELNIDIKVQFALSFIYKAQDDQTKLIEHELDYVFTACIPNSTEILPNLEEVQNIQWISYRDLKEKFLETPENYAFWFREIIKKLEEKDFFKQFNS